MNSDFYLILVIASAAISMWAQYKVHSTFAKYSRVPSEKGVSGAKTAQILMRESGISDVTIRPVGGSLTDNYNPGNKTLNLSEPVFSRTSIAAIGVAAHETGHAVQHKIGYGPLVLRSTLVPAANIGSRFGPLLAVVGFFAGFSALTEIGILLFFGAVIFYLVTLPVEFDASFRALRLLRQTGTLSEKELRGARAVLSAAAMTYVASALTAIVQLLRLLSLRNDRRR